MNSSDIERLRRLPLICAIVVLTWSLAGVTFDSPTHVAVVGVPLLITRPELLPGGLIMASLYGAARYHYFGLMLGSSPYRNRRDILDQLWPDKERSPGTAHTYWGPTTFRSSSSYSDHEKAQSLAATIATAFPRFARARVRSTVQARGDIDQEGDEYTSYHVMVTIPLRCRLAALFQDLDHTAPVWLPLVSASLYALRTFAPNATA